MHFLSHRLQKYIVKTYFTLPAAHLLSQERLSSCGISYLSGFVAYSVDMFGFWKRRKRRHTPPTVPTGERLSDEDYNRLKRENEAYAMYLLQKISRKGEKSLSGTEKAFLDRYARSGYLR